MIDIHIKVDLSSILINMQSLDDYTVRKYDNLDEVIKRADILVKENMVKYDKTDDYKTMFSLIDYTTLEVNDTDERVLKMVNTVNEFHEVNPNIPYVAAMCVYPPFVSIVKKNLKAKGVSIASVAGSFPSSQTTLDVKFVEVKHCLDDGADEIDIVLPVGKFFEGKFEEIFKEIQTLKNLCGSKILKVILEVDALKDPNAIYNASMLAMDAGADFIKTSTGKITREKESFEGRILVMCDAIKQFNAKHNCKVAIKPAGGMRTAEQALRIYTLISEVLGKHYQSNKLFRLGASSLTDSLIQKISSDKAEESK